MDLGLRNKRALVTAASRGLGLASARALGTEGARVAMTGRSIDDLKREADTIARAGQTETLPLTMDLCDPASIAAGVDDVLRRWGGIDILIANTPGPAAGPFVSIDRQTWQAALDMTLMPVIDLIQRVIPSMRANGGGRILCITTVGVKTAQPSMVLSNATRLAITGIAKTLSVELASDNILVNTLCPGPIDTDRMVGLIDATQKEKGIGREQAEAIWLDEVPLKRMGRAEDFGKLASVLVSDVASYVTGAALAVDGGKSGLLSMADRAANRFEGGDLVVKSLKALGVKQIFSVSGGPLNSIYSACATHELPLHHTRHEAGACFMAEAISRLTGVPGVVAVTLGPGVTNTVTPALVAKMAGTPLLILGAQANTGSSERGAGMSADHIPIMTPVTKFAARVLQTERIPEYIEMAFRKMWAGTPGPAFLEIPVNVLSAPAVDGAVPAFAHAWPGLLQHDRDILCKAIASARRPLLLIGDDVRWNPPPQLRSVVERLHLPFATLRLARGAIDETHPLCIGPGYIPCNKTLQRGLRDADVVILLGHHFEFDLEFGRSLGPETRVLQCVIDPDKLGRNRHADFGAISSPVAFVDMLAEIAANNLDRRWVDGLASVWRAERDAQLGATEINSPLHPVAAVDAVISSLPEDVTLACSHGNVDFWVDARVQLKHPNRYLRAGQSGALGAEVPYGIGACFAYPTRPAIVFVGDGGVGFHVTELETAARHNRAVIIVVLDDQKWGAIAIPQRMAYGGEFEMDLPTRDWVKVAEGLGGFGAHARTPAEIASAIRSALASGKPAIVQIPVRSVLSPYMAHIS